jgi:hypothetical protein
MMHLKALSLMKCKQTQGEALMNITISQKLFLGVDSFSYDVVISNVHQDIVKLVRKGNLVTGEFQ